MGPSIFETIPVNVIIHCNVHDQNRNLDLHYENLEGLYRYGSQFIKIAIKKWSWYVHSFFIFLISLHVSKV